MQNGIFKTFRQVTFRLRSLIAWRVKQLATPLWILLLAFFLIWLVIAHGLMTTRNLFLLLIVGLPALILFSAITRHYLLELINIQQSQNLSTIVILKLLKRPVLSLAILLLFAICIDFVALALDIYKSFGTVGYAGMVIAILIGTIALSCIGLTVAVRRLGVP